MKPYEITSWLSHKATEHLEKSKRSFDQWIETGEKHYMDSHLLAVGQAFAYQNVIRKIEELEN